jgi:LysM repeat protein
VNAGETPYDISQANAIQLDYLLEYNNLNENDELKPGTRIFLQEAAMNANYQEEPTTKDSSKNSAKIHLVQPKEGLYAISKKYNVSVQDIKEWNNLTSDALKVGQQLIIAK